MLSAIVLYIWNIRSLDTLKEIMKPLTIVLNILLPPLAVFLQHGLGGTFLISLLLTAIGWLPGVIHAFIVNE